MTPEQLLEQKDLAEQVRNLYKDEVSASLIEQGYYQMINESFTDGIFRFDFKAVTGDKDNRMMLFDVYVDDPVIDKEEKWGHVWFQRMEGKEG